MNQMHVFIIKITIIDQDMNLKIISIIIYCIMLF